MHVTDVTLGVYKQNLNAGLLRTGMNMANVGFLRADAVCVRFARHCGKNMGLINKG